MVVECDAAVLGKFFTLQTLLHAAPDDKWLGDVLCTAVTELPGVCSAALYLKGKHKAQASRLDCHLDWPSICPEEHSSLDFPSVSAVSHFHIRSPRENYGYFFVAVTDAEPLEPYLAHIENTLGLVSLILENKQQNAMLRVLNEELEEKVKERTLALEDREMHARRILDSAAEAIYGLDKEGNCTFCNQSALTLLGYPSEQDLLGRNMHDTIHHTQKDGTAFPAEECHIFKSFQSGDKIHADNDVLWRLDGASFDAEVWSHPIIHQGKAVGAVVTFIDITERKRVEAEIAQHRAETQAILNSIADAIVFADPQRQIQMVNPAFGRMFGYRLKDIVGQTTQIIYAEPEDYAAQGKQRYNKNATADKPVYDVTYRRKDGTTFPGETIGSQVINEQGELLGFLGVIRDVTETRKVEQELAQHRYHLELLVKDRTLKLEEAQSELLQTERLATLGKLTATVSHELRNPLGTIQTALFTIADSLKRKAPQDTERAIELAERNILR
ncbi:MAG: PAS domain S-box protein, partial [Desulfuromonadales bacterium]|nr:PAS domain S-box protein [Desulfuromonadales bacterium]